uniref:Putative alpha-tubulin suppressor n=1 Tax=Corethrella appendiculata TaxID=1370023 RepID=U5EG74_9DIPT
MYSWGANSHGQLALGTITEMCETPLKVTKLPFKLNEIKAIEGGGGHTIILNKDGSTFSCGWNNKGQLGLGHQNDVSEFVEIEHYKFKDIKCGWDVSAGITEDDELFIWGSNTSFQMGNKNEKLSTVPIKLELPNSEVPAQISFGLRHTCVLTKTNAIFVFGKSKCCDKISHFCESITHNDLLYLKYVPKIKIKDICCGENHFLLLGVDNTIHAFGDDKFKQCSPEIDKNPKRHEIISIKSGWTHCGYLTSDGKISMWGRNNYGQLAKPPESISCTVPNPISVNIDEKVNQFYLGSQHGLVVTTKGIYTWGWNEHGNCGNGDTKNL